MQELNLPVGTILKAKKGTRQGEKKITKIKITKILFSGFCNIREKEITEYATVVYFLGGDSTESFASSYNILDFYEA